MNSNIFNIETKYLEIMSALEENDGELTPELAEALTINEKDRDHKMQSYAYVIKQKEADNDTIKDEIARLKAMVNSNIKVVKRLKSTIMQALELFGLRNNNGNLAHRLQYHNMFTRKTKAVELIERVFDEDAQNEYSDILVFSLNSKLDKAQADMIQNVLSEENENYMQPDYTITVDKAAFKEAKENVEYIIDDSEKEAENERLGAVGIVVDNVSLTIR